MKHKKTDGWEVAALAVGFVVILLAALGSILLTAVGVAWAWNSWSLPDVGWPLVRLMVLLYGAAFAVWTSYGLARHLWGPDDE